MTMPRNIVLTGFMGTGKSTVGRLVAARLNRPFVDTDDLIVAEHGPVAEIFAVQGEDYFRSIERETARSLSRQRGLVIATGGGLLLDLTNAELLESSGDVYCLTARIDTLVDRIIGDGTGPVRPLLAGGDPRTRIAEMLADRAAGYSRYIPIATDNLTPYEVAAEITSHTAANQGDRP